MSKTGKARVVVAGMAVAMGLSANAALVTWANDPEIFGVSGAAVAVDSGHFIRLYSAGADQTINFSIVNSAIVLGAGDAFTGVQFDWADGGDVGFCLKEIQDAELNGLTLGSYIYSVIFDGSLTSGNLAIIDSAPTLVTATGAQGQQAYNPGGVIGGLQDNGGDWQAIPEPATFLLFAVGGMGAWMIRRNKLQVKEEADA